LTKKIVEIKIWQWNVGLAIKQADCKDQQEREQGYREGDRPRLQIGAHMLTASDEPMNLHPVVAGTLDLSILCWIARRTL